jgi:hypothetical protein
MVMNFVSYKLCKLFVCLMCFQVFFVCINHFRNLHHFLLGLKNVEEGFYCMLTSDVTSELLETLLNQPQTYSNWEAGVKWDG